MEGRVDLELRTYVVAVNISIHVCYCVTGQRICDMEWGMVADWIVEHPHTSAVVTRNTRCSEVLWSRQVQQ